MGVFVAFEGGDGVGKSTQIQLARDWVSSQGWQVVTTREPGGTALGDSLRELLLHAEEDVSPRAEALLFAADRAQHAAQVIIPAINAGKVVITDRFMASSVAYQGNGRALGAAEIRDLSLWATGGQIADFRRTQRQIAICVAVGNRGVAGYGSGAGGFAPGGGSSAG